MSFPYSHIYTWIQFTHAHACVHSHIPTHPASRVHPCLSLRLTELEFLVKTQSFEHTVTSSLHLAMRLIVPRPDSGECPLIWAAQVQLCHNDLWESWGGVRLWGWRPFAGVDFGAHVAQYLGMRGIPYLQCCLPLKGWTSFLGPTL